MPRLTNRSGESSGISTTSRSFSICSLHPPTSPYVTSGLSSTVIIVTDGSILGGRGRRIWYLLRSTLSALAFDAAAAACIPDAHALLDVCRAHALAQVDDELGNLL